MLGAASVAYSMPSLTSPRFVIAHRARTAWRRQIRRRLRPRLLPRRRGKRMLLYAVAIQTGLRSSELATMTRGSLFLDHVQPFITCQASDTKNKQAARLYIHEDVAQLLRDHIASKAPPSSRCRMFPASPRCSTLILRAHDASGFTRHKVQTNAYDAIRATFSRSGTTTVRPPTSTR